MPSTPTVSIGLPVYNGARFLAASIDSLLAQTFADFELVISDNASTDETEEICREYAAGDPRIRYLRHATNHGAARNFNSLVGHAAGRYFKWATHDDVHAPTFVERCLDAFREGGDRIALAYPRTRIIDEHGEFLRDYVDAIDARQHTPHERLRTLLTNLDMGNPMFGLMQRSTLERTRLNGSFPSSDYVLLAELALLGEIWEIPEFLFFRRDHPNTSRRANATAEDIAEWFEPGSARRHKREFTRLLVEHVRSIHSLPLALPERLRCDLTFADVWLRSNGVHVVGELLGMEYRGGRIPFRRRATARSRV